MLVPLTRTNLAGDIEAFFGEDASPQKLTVRAAVDQYLAQSFMLPMTDRSFVELIRETPGVVLDSDLLFFSHGVEENVGYLRLVPAHLGHRFALNADEMATLLPSSDADALGRNYASRTDRHVWSRPDDVFTFTMRDAHAWGERFGVGVNILEFADHSIAVGISTGHSEAVWHGFANLAEAERWLAITAEDYA